MGYSASRLQLRGRKGSRKKNKGGGPGDGLTAIGTSLGRSQTKKGGEKKSKGGERGKRTFYVMDAFIRYALMPLEPGEKKRGRRTGRSVTHNRRGEKRRIFEGGGKRKKGKERRVTI